MAERPHGVRAKYSIEKCRCEECRAANRAYAASRSRRLIGERYGAPATWVDAEPIREHVRALQAAGLGWRRIAEIAGLPGVTLSKLLYGAPSQGRPPLKRVHRNTAAKLLAVQATEANLADHQLVDATGTTRRLRALMAIGWSRASLAAKLGTATGNLGARMEQGYVWADTARAVRRLYDEMWDQKPPTATHHQRVAVSRTKTIAMRAGWAPPAAWDDDEIDDPLKRPHVAREFGRQLDLAEVDRLRADGVPYTEIAQRLGFTVNSIKSARWRNQQKRSA